MSEHILKSHNKTLLLYHLVFPLKYRRKAISEEVGESLKNVCLEISYRYELQFVEIGYEIDHVHFLVQSVPNYSVSKMVRMLKSITAKQLFQRFPEIKTKSWGGKIFTVSGPETEVIDYTEQSQQAMYLVYHTIWHILSGITAMIWAVSVTTSGGKHGK